QRNFARLIGIEGVNHYLVRIMNGLRHIVAIAILQLERRVSKDMTVAFAMYPTTVDELMAIADSGNIMPPKSTWFEPKLLSGLFVHKL
ncbi:MAG: hypothetical protein RSD17_06420, partial [Oscillospiraceae bacterium]